MQCMCTHMPKISFVALLDPRPWLEGSYGFGSVHPSVQKFSWDLLIIFFWNSPWFRGPYGVVCDRARFLEKKNFYPKNGENGPKIGFFEFIGKFTHYFFLSLVCKESLYLLLYSFTNPILGKNLVPEIWAKMLLANQIAGFLIQLYLYKKII